MADVPVVAGLSRIGGVRGVRYFWKLLVASGFDESEATRLARLAYRCIRRDAGPRELFDRWYAALALGVPDFSVYGEPDYLAEAWLCWHAYSRKYVRCAEGIASTLVAPHGTVLDLGNGLGVTSAALTQAFPRARVVGTNIDGTIQHRVASLLADAYGFEQRSSLDGLDDGSIDLAFASEYFEHFADPLAELRSILDVVRPRHWLIANAFTSDAIGHFDEYPEAKPRLMGRAFGDVMRARGYESVSTSFWNNRPALWREVDRAEGR